MFRQWLERLEGASALIIMQVHDELVLEVDDGALDETQAAVIELMAVRQN